MTLARSLPYVLVLVIHGCAARQVFLEVDPPDAEVLESGRLVGNRSPLAFTLSYEHQDPSTGSYLPRRVSIRKQDFEGAELEIPYASDPFRHKVSLRRTAKRMPLIELDPITNELRTRIVLAMLDTIEKSSAVRGASQITNYTQADCAEPTLNQVERIDASPKDGRIVYALSYYIDPKAKRRASSLWAVEQGFALTRLTGTESLDLDPTFSEDGRTIYFSSNRLGPMAIYSIDASQPAGITTVTAGGAADTWPTCCEESGTLAYASLPPQASVQQVWTVPPNGLRRTQLRQGYQPCWSPKGDFIVFTSVDPRSGKWKIWSMRPDGSGMTTLTSQAEGDDLMPGVSPDGSRIAFASNRQRVLTPGGEDETNFDIWVMNTDGTALTQITENRSHDDFPTWSADGRRILFRSNRGGAWNIWSVQLVEASTPFPPAKPAGQQ
jgi:dipeptidyl aminopeptidase/acylaminoacyl peptidase